MMIRNSVNTVLLLVAVVSLGCSRSPSPEQIVRNYIAAQASHNIDLSLEYFDEQSSFVMPGGGVGLTGIEAIRKMAQYDSVLNTKLHIEDLKADGNTVTCRITETNRWLEIAGLPPLKYDSTMFYVIGGKIRKIVAFPSDSSVNNLTTAMNTFISWLVQTHLEEAKTMMPGGEFVYSAANAETILRLLAEWRDSSAVE